MKLADSAIDNKVFTLVLTVVILGAGVMAFQGMSRLEDPEFTIKDALVVTPYPGATAFEVEEEVSDAIEIAVQKLGQLEEIESRWVPGLSTVTVTIKDKYDRSTLPQVWDELRRKVNDAQGDLPPGAGPSMVIDDFGDVYGIFFTVSSDDYSYAELKEVVDLLRRELLLVEDVAKVETFGERVEAVYVELDRDRMSQLGISPDIIVNELREKNLVADAGRVQVGSEFIAIYPTGEFNDIADFENMWLSGGSDQIYLRDVAAVRRAYLEPPANLIVHDGRRSIGVGISTASGGNVVVMGQAVEQRMRELIPADSAWYRDRNRLPAIRGGDHGDRRVRHQPVAGGVDRGRRAAVLHGRAKRPPDRLRPAGHHHRELHCHEVAGHPARTHLPRRLDHRPRNARRQRHRRHRGHADSHRRRVKAREAREVVGQNQCPSSGRPSSP